MQSTLKAILFDHDGTLVDSEGLHYQIWAKVLEAYGVDLSEQQYMRYYAGIPSGANAIDMIERFELQVSPSVLASAKETITREFLAQQAFPLMADALASLRFCKSRGLRLAIVTGASKYGVDATLRVHALDDYFATVVAGDDVVNGKPAPDCYLLAIQRLAIDPSECIAIEDTEHGLVAANAAGIACLGVPTPMSEHHDFSLASGVFSTLSDALQWVETHWQLGETTDGSQ